LKFNGTHQLLDYAEDANILGGSVHTIQEHAKALAAASKDIGLEVNADKLRTWSYLEIRMQEISQYKRLVIAPLKGLTVQYLGTILKNQNSILEELKSIMLSGNAN
jgi:histidinol phosphatase-like PHP family hydrolase